MADDIKVPVVGKQPKRTVYMIGGVFFVVIGVAYYRSKKAASANAVAAATDTTQIDPATGFAYGSAEDANALSQQAGYISPSGNSGGSGGSSTPNVPTDNGGWDQLAQQYLVGVANVDSQIASSALGVYITGQPATDAQKDIIQQAIAAVGYPPKPGPSGYPPAIQQAPADGGTPGGGTTTPPPDDGTGGGTTTPPPAPKVLAAPSLHIVSHKTGSTVLAWTAVPGAYTYQIYLNGKSHQFSGLPTATVLPAGVYTVKAEPSTSSANAGYTNSPLSNPVTVPK